MKDYFLIIFLYFSWFYFRNKVPGGCVLARFEFGFIRVAPMKFFHAFFCTKTTAKTCRYWARAVSLKDWFFKNLKSWNLITWCKCWCCLWNIKQIKELSTFSRFLVNRLLTFFQVNAQMKILDKNVARIMHIHFCNERTI